MTSPSGELLRKFAREAVKSATELGAAKAAERTELERQWTDAGMTKCPHGWWLALESGEECDCTEYALELHAIRTRGNR